MTRDRTRRRWQRKWQKTHCDDCPVLPKRKHARLDDQPEPSQCTVCPARDRYPKHDPGDTWRGECGNCFGVGWIEADSTNNLSPVEQDWWLCWICNFDRAKPMPGAPKANP